MTGFVAVHLGAGHHSSEMGKAYRKLCRTACESASVILNGNGTAMDAVEAALIQLENSGLTNAGFGSNLTWDGRVEGDASIMDGRTLRFGACGAVPDVRNPISLAKRICERQDAPLHLGRVPPCILTGEGAKRWARGVGLQIVDGDQMISPSALKKYRRYKKKLKNYCQHNNFEYGPLDTVGAICVDPSGNVAAAASSGGVSLKHPGRVGQAASFASGVWAEGAVASCTSGCGEHLIRTQLARSAAESLRGECPTAGLSRCLDDGFCRSPFLRGIPEKLGGVLALRLDGERGEFLWGHTTPSMCLGYMSSKDAHSKYVMSRLPSNIKSGSGSIVGGIPFTVTIQTPPPVEWTILTKDAVNGKSIN